MPRTNVFHDASNYIDHEGDAYYDARNTSRGGRRHVGIANLPGHLVMQEIVSRMGPRNGMHLSLASKQFANAAALGKRLTRVDKALTSASQKVAGGLTWLIARALATPSKYPEEFRSALRATSRVRAGIPVFPVRDLKKQVRITNELYVQLVIAEYGFVNLQTNREATIAFNAYVLKGGVQKMVRFWNIPVKRVEGVIKLGSLDNIVRGRTPFSKATAWLMENAVKGGVKMYNKNPVAVW